MAYAGFMSPVVNKEYKAVAIVFTRPMYDSEANDTCSHVQVPSAIYRVAPKK